MGAVLSRSPPTLAGTNSVPIREAVVDVHGDDGACQTLPTLPAGTSAIRISLAAGVGPRVRLTVFAGTRVLTRGERPAGWVDGDVTVPVKRVARTARGVLICTTVGPAVERLEIGGTPVKSHHQGHDLAAVTLRMEYLRSGASSWLSLVPSISRCLGLGHAAAGTWIVLLLFALMLAVAILAARLTLKGAAARGRAPLICALVALLNATCWSIITPPFQVPDEPSHFAYTQELAEAQRLPTLGESNYSHEENAALRDLHHYEVTWHPERRTISSLAEQQRLERHLASPLSRRGEGKVGVAASEPPLYYALELVPYELGSSGTLLDQLELMRLLSALMGGLTALFSFLFLREALPRFPWAWTVGGLSVALAPLLGFISGAVNPDSMLAAVSAAIFYCLARAFRRGLTQRLAIAIGVLTAVGFLTKLNFIGLAPGVILGLVVLAVRAWRVHGRGGLRTPAYALAIAASPVVLYLIVNLLSGHVGLGIASRTLADHSARKSLSSEISYIWQFYLPRLPGMGSGYFPGILTTRQLWFDRAVGLYGWIDTSFPTWVYNLALLPAAVILLLCVRALAAGRASVRARLGEIGVYAAMGLGLMVLVAGDAYLSLGTESVGYIEPRYFLPLLPLLAAVLALAARGAGRRWGPAVGALIVVLFLAHDLFSQLQVIARFYG